VRFEHGADVLLDPLATFVYDEEHGSVELHWDNLLDSDYNLNYSSTSFEPFDGVMPRPLGRGLKCRSGSTLSKHWHLCPGAEGLTLRIAPKMRRYLIFVSAGLGLLMYSIGSTVVAVAFPNFIKRLRHQCPLGSMDYFNLSGCGYECHAVNGQPER